MKKILAVFCLLLALAGCKAIDPAPKPVGRLALLGTDEEALSQAAQVSFELVYATAATRAQMIASGQADAAFCCEIDHYGFPFSDVPLA